MNVVESSFKELMGFMSIYPVRRCSVIETLKNITHQSFNDKNIFDSPLVDCKGKVQLKYGTFPNHIPKEQWEEHPDFQYDQWYSMTSGIIIPLVSPKWSVGSKARLVISSPDNYYTNIQISIQFYVDNVDKWVSVPCRTNTVKETIMNLFPQE